MCRGCKKVRATTLLAILFSCCLDNAYWLLLSVEGRCKDFTAMSLMLSNSARKAACFCSLCSLLVSSSWSVPVS